MPGNDHLLAVLRGSAAFPATHWSLVLQAARPKQGRAVEALESLCRSYWYPLYAYVRRSGFTPDDAQDIVQGFLETLLARDDLLSVTPDKGRFRTFLLTALSHYVSNHRRASRCQRRGGNHAHFSLDGLPAEERFRLEAATGDSPERLYDRKWAWELLSQARQKLRTEYTRAGKGDLFVLLEPFLVDGRDAELRARVAARLGVTPGAVDVALHRLRRKFGESVRQLIVETLADPKDVDEELQHLKLALRCA